MGYERHIPDAVRLAGKVQLPAADLMRGFPSGYFDTPKIVAARKPETDLPRQARQLRGEWRRERYARLKG